MRMDLQRLYQHVKKRDCSSDEMVDSEDIIRAVKKFRAIWDLEDEGYHNKNLKDEAWNGVCLELISDWKFLCEGEKFIRLSEIKKKWNNIRDYYKKLLSETRSGEQEVRSKKRRYLYSDILEFIRPVYDKRRHETATNDPDDFSIQNIASHNAQSYHLQDSENDGQHMETVTFIGIPTKCSVPKRLGNCTNAVDEQNQRHHTRPLHRKKRKSPPLTAFERTVLKSLEKNEPKDEDPDLLFLKSLLPDMKKLTSTQKFDFKLGIMEVYRNICNNTDASNYKQDVEHDHNYDLEIDGQVKVETVRLSADEDSYQSVD